MNFNQAKLDSLITALTAARDELKRGDTETVADCLQIAEQHWHSFWRQP
jgi:hypothetical protein